MAKAKGSRKRKKSRNTKPTNSFDLKPSTYQPTKAELEEELSVPVSLEQLGRAAVQGGVPRRT